MNANLIQVLVIAFSLFLFTNCSYSQKKIKKTAANETLEGVFTSKKGVMHNISCYCYNVGFLKTNKDEKLVICFDRMDTEDAPKCKKLSVTGYFEMHTVKEGSNSPCPGGERNIFYVVEFECKD